MLRAAQVGLPVLLVVLAAALGACGSDEAAAPKLAAIPTRTPVPATSTPETGQPSVAVEVISLRDEIDAFLTASETASAVDRIDLFSEHVIQPAGECLSGAFYPGVEPLEMLGFNLTSIPMEGWREATDSFPEKDLVASVNDTLAAAVALLPADRSITVCLMPVPLFGPPEDIVNSGVGVQALAGDHLVLTCSAGSICLERVGPEVAHAYSMAYQIDRAGLTAFEMPLLAYVVAYGRGEDFARQLMPETTFRWDGALTPEQEIDLWTRMQEYLETTYQDYPGYRNMDPFLYGEPNSDRYPRFGGQYIGSRIVRAYRLQHPDISAAELATLPPKTLLADSGYSPG